MLRLQNPIRASQGTRRALTTLPRWARPVVRVPAAPGMWRSFEFPGAQGRQSFGPPQGRGSAQCPFSAHWTSIEPENLALWVSQHLSSCLWFPLKHNTVQYSFIPAIVFAKLCALKNLYLFVLASITIYEHVPFYIFLAHSKPCML